MAYTPINWQNGDTITAEKMNKMDNGWAVQSSQLFSETVTTSSDPEYPEDPAWGDLSYAQFIDADTIVVTFNGNEYACPKTDSEGANFYGGWGTDGPDFSDIPFAIISDSGFGNSVATENGGTYTISASAEVIETSQEFQSSVNSCVDTSTMPMECVSNVTTYQEMVRAYGDGRILFFKPYGSLISVRFIIGVADSTVSFIPESSNISARIDNGIFKVAIT